MSYMLTKERNCVCEECGTQFYRRPNRVMKCNFCTMKCYRLWLKKNRNPNLNITFNCEVCGKEVTQKEANYNQSKKHFCSKKCFYTTLEKYKDVNKVYGKKIHICKVCKKPFRHTRTKIGKRYMLSSTVFCSDECKEKWKNPTTSKLKRIGHATKEWKRTNDFVSYTKGDLLEILNKHSREAVYNKQTCCYSSLAIKKTLSFIVDNNEIYDQDTFIKAVEFLELVGGCIQGKSRLAIISAVIYMSNKGKYSQETVAKTCFVSMVSLRNLRDDLEEIYRESEYVFRFRKKVLTKKE